MNLYLMFFPPLLLLALLLLNVFVLPRRRNGQSDSGASAGTTLPKTELRLDERTVRPAQEVTSARR